MELRNIALSDLKIANVNVRQSRKASDVSRHPAIDPRTWCPSAPAGSAPRLRLRDRLRTATLFCSKPRGGRAGVPIEEVLLPCAVTADDGDADAMEASLIENVARAPMDELEEYEAFAKLLKQGRNVPDIAKTFGLTERYVKLRLARLSGQRRIGMATSKPKSCNCLPTPPGANRRTGSQLF